MPRVAIDHQISDRESFEEVTGSGHQVAGIYFFYELDVLVDLAHRVSHDFFARPELFTDLSDGESASIAPILGRLRARYGSDERYLDRPQRRALYAALFGRPSSGADPFAEEEGNFPRLRDELLEACATFVETKFGDDVSLRENVRQKHRLFREYLTGLQGASVEWSREQSLAVLTEQVAYRILRNRGVSAIYGIAAPPRADWPYTFDSNAAKLVEEVSKQLMEPAGNGATGGDGKGTQPFVSRERITSLQRAALEGARAIATVIDVDSGSGDDEIDLLIRKCYTWATALRSLAERPRMPSPAPGQRVPAPAAMARLPEKPRAGIAIAQPAAGAFAPADGR
jgi:hypothetical protein